MQPAKLRSECDAGRGLKGVKRFVKKILHVRACHGFLVQGNVIPVWPEGVSVKNACYRSTDGRKCDSS